MGRHASQWAGAAVQWNKTVNIFLYTIALLPLCPVTAWFQHWGVWLECAFFAKDKWNFASIAGDGRTPRSCWDAIKPAFSFHGYVIYWYIGVCLSPFAFWRMWNSTCGKNIMTVALQIRRSWRTLHLSLCSQASMKYNRCQQICGSVLVWANRWLMYFVSGWTGRYQSSLSS